MKKKSLFLMVSIVGVLLLASCSGSSKTVEVTIDMLEYAFDPQTLSFKVGDEVVITVTNSGEEPHEILFGRNVVILDNGQPDGYEVDLFILTGVEPVVSGLNNDHDDDDHDEGEDHDDAGDDHDEGEEHDDAEDTHDDEGEEHDDAEDTHDDDDDGHEHAYEGYMWSLDVGDDFYTISFTVTEEMVGNWEIGCFWSDGGHYEEGMIGFLTINK